MKAHVLIFVVALLAGCGRNSSASAAAYSAVTGAKAVVDEFGQYVEVDEECGGTDLPEYADHFQNAMYRDGDIAGGRLWMVDGSHLWSAPAPVTPDSDVRPEIEVPFVGIANAVAAGENFVAVATLDQGVRLFAGYDFAQGVRLGDDVRTLDVDVSADGMLLAVAAGKKGIVVYDVTDPYHPLKIERFETEGFVSGVRWGVDEDDKPFLYWAACSHGGFVDFKTPHGPQMNDMAFGHPNVKDAHGDGDTFVVANNGGGVEFFEMSTLRAWRGYDIDDPLFYANAVFVSGPFAFVAAGNREMLALLLSDAQPAGELTRDPISILVDENTVYGFGNFREVGERTVVRAPRIVRPEEADAFAEGYPSWTEPKANALRSGDATHEYLARRAPGGYEVFRAAFTESTWTRLDGYRFFAYAGTYAVSVTADGWVKAFAPGMTEPAALGKWYSPFPNDGHAELFDGAVVVYFHGDKRRREYAWDPAFLSQPLAEPPAILCDLPAAKATEDSFGFYYHGVNRDAVTVRWCSRLVDPFVPVYRPEGDLGTRVRIYADGVTADVRLPVSGVAKVIAPGPKTLYTMIDDRIAFTTSLVAWDVAGGGVPRERSRYVRFGRPSNWLPMADGKVRVWLTDGAMFTYDFNDGGVTDALPPVERGAP